MPHRNAKPQQELRLGTPLRLLELYNAQDLVGDVLARKPVRVSIPESVARFLAMKDLDWSREVELPPDPVPEAAAPAADPENLARQMADLESRFLVLQRLTYALGGRILCTMLGGDHYAARLEWHAAPAAAAPAGVP